MDRHRQDWTPISSIDVTVDAPSPLSSSAIPADEMPRVSLVEGSDPGLSGEIQALLRRRLRLAALLLFAGFTAFLVRSIFLIVLPIQNLLSELSAQHRIAFTVFQAVVTLVLGLCGGMLCQRCTISTRILRIKELVVFGMPAVFFLWLQYIDMTSCAGKGYLPNPGASWLVLIFTYALFVPNNWPRAAAVIGTMAAAPVVMTVVLVLFHKTCAEVPQAGFTFVSTVVLMMSVSAVAAVLGVDTIGDLRYEAFEARQLGQYRLKRRIGSGGMGEVFLAEHQLMKRPCAIKLIRPEKAGDPRVLARFEREVRSTAKLSHWNNIDIFDYGRASCGTFYYVMEFLPGMNLDQLVQQYGPLASERVIHFLLQTCDALSEAHQLGMVHRDIKPANIFSAHRGGKYDVVKLLDFGLAKPLSSDEPSELTQEGTIAGSPLYISPEQVLGESEPDARSDIYSLGAVAYYVLSGRPPFAHDKPMKVLFAHAREEPTDLSAVASGVPDELRAVVMRCLAKDPDDRYQNAMELADALSRCHLAGTWTWSAAARWWREVAPAERQAVEAAV